MEDDKGHGGKGNERIGDSAVNIALLGTSSRHHLAIDIESYDNISSNFKIYQILKNWYQQENLANFSDH